MAAAKRRLKKKPAKKSKNKKKKPLSKGAKVFLVLLAMAFLTIFLVVGGNALSKALTAAKIVMVQTDLVEGGSGMGPGQFKEPWDCAVDSKGDVFATDFGGHRVQEFDPTGKLLNSFGKEGKDPGDFEQPSGIFIDSNNVVFVCDTFNHRIEKFDPTGKLIKFWANSFYGPKGIGGDGHSRIYISDTGNHKVQAFDEDGNFLTQWGSYGSEVGKLREPVGLTVDNQGFVYVADTDNLRVDKFDPNGKVVGIIKIPTWKGKSAETPYLAFGAGSLWVANTSENSVLQYTPTGKLLAIFKDKNGGFTDAAGVALDPNGEVYVTERGPGKIVRFMPPPKAH
jgi:DNA-binding beta-propeller fold protein YncE